MSNSDDPVTNVVQLPLLPLRDVVVFPHMVIPLFVGRPKSIKALETAMEAGKSIVLIAQKSAAKDERAVYDFVHELYKTKRVSDRTYKRLHALLGDAGLVEFVGILGYYVMISMTLNVFRMMPPADAELAFAEPK